MSVRSDFIDILKDVAGPALLQESPYAVTAPRTPDTAAALVCQAREHGYRVMVLGTGSSFPHDFAMMREDVLVLMTAAMTGVTSLSPFVIRVFSGSRVNRLLPGWGATRKTVGGLVCGVPEGANADALCALWPRVKSVDVITGSGELLSLPAADGCREVPQAAEMLIGSRGRLGLLISLDILAPLPVLEKSALIRGGCVGREGRGEPALSAGELQAAFDHSGVFQW